MISTDRGNWECPTVKALLLACALATLPALRTVVIDAAIAAVGFLISTTQPAASQAVSVEMIWKQALEGRKEDFKPVSPLVPPARYDHPYTGLLLEKIAEDPIDLAHRCWPQTGKNISGSAFVSGNSTTGENGSGFDSTRYCRIIIAPDYVLAQRQLTREQVRRHEIAHCNGWAGDHPP